MQARATSVACRVGCALLFAACSSVSSAGGSTRAAAQDDTVAQSNAPLAAVEDVASPSAPTPDHVAVVSPRVREPYRHYPSLDLRRVPFHGGSGRWGVPDPVTPPSLPEIRDERVVHNTAEFDGARANHRRIIVAPRSTLRAHVVGYNDLEIRISDGAVITELWAGNNQRLHVHGDTPGKRANGRLDNVDTYAGPITDLVIDGLDSVPTGGTAPFLQHGGAGSLTRVSLTNLRILGGLGLWSADATDIVIAGVNAHNPTDWWWWRIEPPGRFDRVIVFACHLRMYGQPTVRMHQPGKFWFGDTTVVNSTQSRPGPTPPPASGYTFRLQSAAHVWLSNVRAHVQGLVEHPPGSGAFGQPNAEFGPASPRSPALMHVSADSVIVSDVLNYSHLAPAPDVDWKLDATVVPTAGNPVPQWDDRNAAGDPTVLGRR